MGILLGLLAALAWGITDFLLAALTRRIGTAKAMVYTQILSLFVVIAILFVQGKPPAGDLRIWILVLICGLCHVAAMLLGYRAFEIGTLSLVSPLASGFSVVTAVLAIASGERPTPLALLGAALLIFGVITVSRSAADSSETTLAGVPQAIGCAIAAGFVLWILSFAEPKLGPIWPLLVLRIMALSGGIFLWRSQRTQAAHLEPLKAWHLIAALSAGVTIADTVAWLAFNNGVRSEYTTVVTALASLFSAVTVLMAWVLLRERLSRVQWSGVAFVLAGVLLVSLRSQHPSL